VAALKFGKNPHDQGFN